MRIVILDFETEYSDTFTLTKMTTESYIRDKRFKAHGAAIKWQSNIPARWYAEPELRAVLAGEDWSNTWIVCHHGQFDLAILAWHYDVHPRLLGDTLAMARHLLGNHISVSLDSVRKEFGIPAKRTPYHLFKGKTWQQLTPQEQELLADGCADEVESIYTVFVKMAKELPAEELEIIDISLRMFVEPRLRGDIDVLARLWESEDRRKTKMLTDLDVPESELQSADKFKALLEAEGVEVEYKAGKNGPIPAFAKNDEFMQRLMEDEDDRVQALALARLGVKSTILQTRAETLGFMAQRGDMPVYLRYCGAMTLRFSGGDGANWQNFKRKDEDSPKEASPLRRAILAPDNYLLCPVDLSQIEARVLAYVAGQQDAIEEFRRGDDPYVTLASAAYGRPVTKDMKLERGTGKQLKLSCGYMAAEATIQKTARLGIYGPPVHIDLDTARRWKTIYREQNPMICYYWKQASRMISRLAGGSPVDWGPLRVADSKIWLPNGARINYDSLEYHVPTDEEKQKLKEFEYKGFWRMKTRQGWKTMHGGKVTQHVCEAVSRVIVTQAAIRIHRAGFRILNVPHDELLILIPRDGREHDAMEWCRQQMLRTPDWLPGLPLDAEAGLSERYEK